MCQESLPALVLDATSPRLYGCFYAAIENEAFLPIKIEIVLTKADVVFSTGCRCHRLNYDFSLIGMPDFV